MERRENKLSVLLRNYRSGIRHREPHIPACRRIGSTGRQPGRGGGVLGQLLLGGDLLGTTITGTDGTFDAYAGISARPANDIFHVSSTNEIYTELTFVGLGVGYVPQRANVFPSLTVEDNLRMGLFLDPGQFFLKGFLLSMMG